MSNLRKQAAELERPNTLAALAAELLTGHATKLDNGETVFSSDEARDTFDKVNQTGSALVGEFEFSVLVKKAVAHRNEE